MKKTAKKLCLRCKDEKVLSDFSFNKTNNNYSSYCKQCASGNTRRWQKKLFESKTPEDIVEGTLYKVSQSSHSNAKRRNIPYALSIYDLRDMYKEQGGKCHYTGVSMKLHTKEVAKRDPLLLSIDRLDSSVGYTKENTVLCCWGCNALKGDHSVQTLYDMLALFFNSAITSGKIK